MNASTPAKHVIQDDYQPVKNNIHGFLLKPSKTTLYISVEYFHQQLQKSAYIRICKNEQHMIHLTFTWESTSLELNGYAIAREARHAHILLSISVTTCADDIIPCPLQSIVTSPCRTSTRPDVAVNTTLHTGDSWSGLRRAAGVSDRVRWIDQQRTCRI